MYSVIAFIITLAQLLIISGSYLLQSTNIFNTGLIYGSPFYLAMTMLGSESAFLDKNPIYIGLLCFHIFKYFIIFRAQIVDEGGWMRNLAIVFEAAYLILSAYYIN
jgi:hypothetical protein